MANTDEFADYCGKILAREMKKQLKREIDEPGYLAQKAFPDCKSRMSAMVDLAVAPVKSFAGLAAANHRKEEHGEDRPEEIASLTAEIEEEEDAQAALLWFW